MNIQIENKSIFFAVQNCFDQLSNKFKSQLYNKVSENSSDDYVQSLEIDLDTFVLVMNAVNSQPQGIAKNINPLMYDALKAQILSLAQTGDQEAVDIATAMEKILITNETMLQNKINAGKEMILS